MPSAMAQSFTVLPQKIILKKSFIAIRLFVIKIFISQIRQGSQNEKQPEFTILRFDKWDHSNLPHNAWRLMLIPEFFFTYQKKSHLKMRFESRKGK
jgi:hypothetical protein